MATGFATEIDLSKLDKMINKLETNLQRFVDKSKDAQTQVVDAFTNMGTNGVNKFVSQLSGAINQVMEIGKKGSAIKWDSQNLNRYIDQVNQLIKLVQQVGGAGFTLPTANLNKQFASISRLKDDLKVVNELLNKGEKTGVDSNGNAIYRQLVAAEQNYFVELKKNIQEQLKFQQQSIQERLASVKKALQEELKETQETEKKKTQVRNQSYKGAIKYSDKANSLEQERKSIKNLEAARESLKKTDADYSAKLEELNRRINAHRINVEAATKTEAQRNALTSSTRAEYARLLTEQDKLRQSYDKLKQSQATLGSTPESTAALQNIVKRYRDVYAEIQRYKQSANGQLDATERKFLADQASAFAENEKRKTEIAQQEANKRATITSAEAKKVITSASGSKNVNQQIIAIQQLKDARDKLDKTDKDYKKTLESLNNEIKRHQKEIDIARGKTEDANKSHRRLMDTAGQLQRKLALVFSVSAIQGYVSKLVEVRGEFEMQQRSLQVLLQNKDEANALWDKTVALAVKSPFRIKDLVTYTKQLAAYRVESDKLFETNKMLADVSAGLGVDMNRLILAFGQVKAANYLRGTELRQFSEAGVNMLGELAKYFTELEGRAVSVGDVFERVSKRMVTFQDVNEIFKRITSEGGIFFRMQEKQSETLKGMVMNFRDSMDLMLNDIGKDQDSILKNSIRLAKEFVDNWRQFQPYVETAGVAFLAAFGVKTLGGIIKGVKNLMSLMIANPWTALASVVALVVAYIYNASEAQSKLNAAMREVENENLASLEESIGLYKQLTETINDTTKSYEERDKAMSQLKSKFNEILPDQYTELKYVEQLGGNYRDAEQAMLDYYNAKTREQKKARVEQEFASELEGVDITELIASYRKFVDGTNMIGIDESRAKLKIKSGIASVINSVVQDIKSGTIPVNDIQKEISSRLEKFVGDDSIAKSIIGKAEKYGDIKEDISDIIDTLDRYAVALSNIDGLEYETYDQKEAAKMINQEKNNLNTAVNAFKKAASLYQKYVDAIPDATGTVEEKRKKIEEDVKKILTDLPKEMVAYGEYLNVAFSKLKTEADKGAFAFASAIQTIESELYASRDSNGVLDGLAGVALNNVVLNETANDAAKQMIKNFQEGLDEQGQKLKMSTFQKSVNEGIKEIADRFDVSADVFAKFVPTTTDALSTVRQNVKAEIDSMESRLKEFQNSLTQGMYVLSEGVLNETKKSIEEITKLLPAFKSLFAFLGGDLDKNKKGGSGRSNSLYDERIKVIDDMNKKYKELNKTLEKSEALQGAFDAYIDAFATAYEGINWVPDNVRSMSPQEFASKVLNFPDENDLVNFLDRLSKEPMKTFEKIKVELAKGEYVYDMKVRVKSEDDKELLEQIEDMFSGYEMSIELQKMNIPPDLAKQLFNVDSVDLSSIRNKISSELAKAQATGGQEDRVKELKKQLDKVEEMEDKAMQERLKKYVKYMLQAQSERVKIKIDEMNQLSEIEKLNVSELDKNIMRQGVREETQKKLDKAAWEDFKNSDMYVRIFEDLDRASSKALSAMQDKLVELRGSLSDLSPENLKEIVRLEEKIAKAKIDNNPFVGLIQSMKNLKSARKELNKLEEEHGLTYEEGVKKYEEQKRKIDELQISIKKLTDEYGADTPNAVFEKEDLETLKKANKELADILEKMGLLYDKGTSSKLGIKDSFAGMSEIFSQAAQSTNEIADAFDKIGGLSAAQRDNFDTIASIFGGMSGIMSGAEKMASGNPFAMVAGGIQALGGIASVVGEIFAIGDKKKERQIKREIKFVEDLERTYQKLEKQIDKAYEFDTLKGSYDAAQQNIDAQIDSYEKMIAAEEDKKKIDEDRIKEWELTIEDLKEKQREMLESQVEELGGGYDYSAMTEEFVNSWLEAFKETGDGLSGLEDNFEEFWQNIAIKQAVMGGASKIMQPFLDAVNKALENDFKLDDSEMANIDQLSAKAKEDMNAFLEQWYDRWGDFMTQGEQSELSGLQRGIQELTESTGQEIAAYLNSIRFFVAEQNTYLSKIAASFGNTEVENPMVGQLRIIASQTTAINELLNSLTSGGHSMGGRGFRVFIS